VNGKMLVLDLKVLLNRRELDCDDAFAVIDRFLDLLA
jgi:hypothetical protein